MPNDKKFWRIIFYLLPFVFLAIMVPYLFQWTSAERTIQRLSDAALALNELELDGLVAGGIPIDARDETGQTALMRLSGLQGQQSTEGVRLLIHKGAAVKAVDRRGMTALMAAAMTGPVSTVELLIKNGAEVDGFDLNKATALNYAANVLGNKDIVRILLAAGANPDGMGSEEHETPLYQAASRGKFEIVKMLLEHGAKITNKNNSAALIEAAKDGHSDIAVLLLEHGAQVNGEQRCSIISGKETYCSDVPLAAAVESGNIDIVKTFLAKGADPNAKDSKGRSLVQVAREKGFAPIGILLLKAGAEK